MACHELSALRLALMEITGLDDEAEKQHELAELGPAAQAPGPIRCLREARTLADVQRSYETALSDLSEKIARTAPGDGKLPYYQSLLVLTKKVEQDLRIQTGGLRALCRDLEEIHDYLHEIYPA